ncbi:hypothetical protein DITRI_Ditri07aG0158900 [Diplodiscus trichospermus]
MEGSMNSSDNKRVAANQRKGFEGIRLENPFTLKVGQVFTGFGIGCGVGIGVGRPINIGAIPMVGQVMNATRGATDAFSGVSSHVNGALRKLGAKNIEAGIGCGVGLGHGFGVGLAVKPGVVHQIQCCVMQAVTKTMTKFGIAPNLPFSQGASPESFQSGLTTTNELSMQNPLGNMNQMVSKLPDSTFQSLHRPGNMSRGSAYEKFSSRSPTETSFGSRTEKVLNSFMQNPIVKEEETSLNELAGRLRSENYILQLVLKHQQIIEELVEDNQKLQKILMEDLKIPPSKLQASYSIELEKQIFCNLKVVNNTEHHVAFKVKTTSPKKYYVRPNTGVLQPSECCVIRFTLQAQREYPPDMQCKDKFMIQSTIVPPNTNMEDLPADTFNKERNKEIEECKLKVFYISPSARVNSEDEGLKSSTEQTPDSNSDVQHLKSERDAAVRQTLRLQQELKFLKRRRHRRNQCGCFFTFSVSD